MSQSLLLLALAASAGAVSLFVFRASPRATFIAWTLVLFLVPIWVGVSVGFFWAAITLVTLAAIASSLTDVRLTVVDGLAAAFALLVLALFAVKAATLSDTVIALLEWLVPYAWGRIVLARVPAMFVTRTIATVATAAAVLALIEFATRVNVFVMIPGLGNAEWAELQPRASFLRAEGAFGHSIALGASLAMASVFVVLARWRTPVTLLALAAVVGAIVVTFSRIGLVTAALAIAMCVVLSPGITRRLRWAVVATACAAAALIVPFLGAVFLDAGEEAGGSAAYRTGLLALVPEVQLLGSAGDWEGRAVDGVYLGDFADSVDNTLLLIALRFGWIPALLVAAIFALVALGLLRRRANPAAIAVVSQIPALFAVALITQFGMLLWFLVGLAVSWGIVGADGASARAPAAVTLRAPERPPRAGAAPSAGRRT